MEILWLALVTLVTLGVAIAIDRGIRAAMRGRNCQNCGGRLIVFDKRVNAYIPCPKCQGE